MIHDADDTAVVTDISSAENCQVECLNNADCTFFNYHIPTAACYLKTSALTKRENSSPVGEYITGPKVCPTFEELGKYHH